MEFFTKHGYDLPSRERATAMTWELCGEVIDRSSAHTIIFNWMNRYSQTGNPDLAELKTQLTGLPLDSRLISDTVGLSHCVPDSVVREILLLLLSLGAVIGPEPEGLTNIIHRIINGK